MSETWQDDRGTKAFGEQLDSAFGPVLARARIYRDEQLAMEAAGDALAKAFEKWLAEPDYFDSHDLVAWTSQAARWKTLDEFRRRQRHRPLPTDGDAPRNHPAPHGRGESPTIRLRRSGHSEPAARDLERVGRLLERLPSPYREILEGHYYDGLTDLELGEQLFGDEGTPRGRGLRVWRLRQEAQRQLKRLLLQDEEFDPELWCGQPCRQPA